MVSRHRGAIVSVKYVMIHATPYIRTLMCHYVNVLSSMKPRSSSPPLVFVQRPWLSLRPSHMLGIGSMSYIPSALGLHLYGGRSVSKLHRGAVAQLGCTVYSFGYGVFLFGYGLFIPVWSFHLGTHFLLGYIPSSHFGIYTLFFKFGYPVFIIPE